MAVAVERGITISTTNNKETMDESEIGYYNTLRQNSASHIGTAGNVDLHTTSTGKTVGLCHVYGLLWIEEDPITIDSIAASQLAMWHFNTGNGTIVSKLGGINERCDIRFTSEFADTFGSEFLALSTLANVVGEGGNEHEDHREVEHTHEIVEGEGVVHTADPFGGGETSGGLFVESDEEPTLPCAILGATRSASTMPVSMLSGKLFIIFCGCYSYTFVFKTSSRSIHQTIVMPHQDDGLPLFLSAIVCLFGSWMGSDKGGA